MTLPRLAPLSLVRVADAFDDPDWLFELKYDGFRALAYLEGGMVELVSRRGNAFRRFEALARWTRQA